MKNFQPGIHSMLVFCLAGESLHPCLQMELQTCLISSSVKFLCLSSSRQESIKLWCDPSLQVMKKNENKLVKYKDCYILRAYLNLYLPCSNDEVDPPVRQCVLWGFSSLTDWNWQTSYMSFSHNKSETGNCVCTSSTSEIEQEFVMWILNMKDSATHF